ncbi:N-acetylmuramidase, partial [Weissella cibaria]|nr:N-acetylmuramidase [Weissella cibaria]
VDPYGYLSTHGISQTQFAHDLQYGFGSSSSDSSNNTSNDSNKNNSTANINVGSKVTIKTSAKHWATGQTIYTAVKGKTYKVIQVNGNRLLLDKVISWINNGDVTVPGSSSSNHSSSSNSSKNNSNKNNSNKNTNTNS